jgi:hypothetical protein
MPIKNTNDGIAGIWRTGDRTPSIVSKTGTLSIVVLALLLPIPLLPRITTYSIDSLFGMHRRWDGDGLTNTELSRTILLLHLAPM